MDWQMAITGVLIAAAAAYVGRALLRPLVQPGRGCGAACGKCAAPEPAPPPNRICLPQLPSER